MCDKNSTACQHLPLPQLLIELVRQNRWRHLGDNKMREVVPFIQDPLVFPDCIESMFANSRALMSDDQDEDETFSEYRGSKVSERDLPWIDVERMVFIIYNKWPGDDVGIGLDYRTGTEKPRIVGGDWHAGSGLIYREISTTFDEFAGRLGLTA
jgi:hypothetical protein